MVRGSKPYGAKSWSATGAATTTKADGTYSIKVRPRRNTLYRTRSATPPALSRAVPIVVDELTDAVDGRSGLLGLAGTKDMREVLDRRSAGDERATLAQLLRGLLVPIERAARFAPRAVDE